MILQPFKKVIVTSGNMSYDNGLRSWNTIRFKRDLVAEFPELYKRSITTKYTAVVYHSYELLEKEMQDIVRKKKPIPVFLFFEQELVR